MEKERFVEYLKKFSENYEVKERMEAQTSGIMVQDRQFDTMTFFSEKAILDNNIEELLKQTHHGKNVEQITRVTGYFSKVGSWNKGKKAELKDRYRSNIEKVSVQ
ncbi:MAG: anaerobic ribonucleoside-triphosphate reductase [Candidatus Omnitrophica bacterium]|nr:anaerobic ribonucleoside-triphosphate reductase [Candidatus Omnitrophota bacterium]